VLVFNHAILLGALASADRLDGSLAVEDEEESLNNIEIALLALYQADINYQPEPTSTRVPSLQYASIYHSGYRPTNNFPFNVSPSIINAPLHMYPIASIIRITDYTRNVVYYRLFRTLQDFLPAIPEISLIMYGLFIERYITEGTIINDKDALESLFSSQITLLSNAATSTDSLHSPSVAASASTTSLARTFISSQSKSVDCEDWKFLKILVSFLQQSNQRQVAISELYLLWVDAMIYLTPRQAILAELLKKKLLQRAQMELLSQVVLSLQ